MVSRLDRSRDESRGFPRSRALMGVKWSRGFSWSRGVANQVRHKELGLGPWAQGFKTLKPSREALQASLWAWLGPGFPGPAWPGSGLLSRAGTSLISPKSQAFFPGEIRVIGFW
jgi:hypothetical protein